MPSYTNHIQQIERNRAFLNSVDIDNTPFLDWIATVAFYTALHCVEAWFAEQGHGMHFDSHEKRNQEMGKVAEFKKIIWPRYRELQTQSHRARYQCVIPTRPLIQTKVLPYLDEIEEEIHRLLD